MVQYVNNVSDMLSENGIINFFLEICNLIFVTVFMFITDARLALVIIAGLPVLIVMWGYYAEAAAGLAEFLNKTPT